MKININQSSVYVYILSQKSQFNYNLLQFYGPNCQIHKVFGFELFVPGTRQTLAATNLERFHLHFSKKNQCDPVFGIKFCQQIG